MRNRPDFSRAQFHEKSKQRNRLGGTGLEPSEKAQQFDDSAGGAAKGAAFPTFAGPDSTTADALIATGEPSGSPAAPVPAGRFADSIAAILRLPLTDAEKAEAVRRLMNSAGP
ncbi:MAG: hypothetical protein U1A27_01090 [Phycisphaerae bacterium]